MPEALDLARQARAGDRAALGELLRTHRGAAFAFALSLQGNAADAEDACGEAFLQAVRGVGKFRPGGSFKAWLLCLVRSAALGQLRAEKARRAREEAKAMTTTYPEPPTAAGSAETAAAVQGALSALDERYRLPVMLHYGQGLSHAEIAEVLDVPQGTVGVYIARGLEKLRETLSRAGLSAALVMTGLAALPLPAAPASLEAAIDAALREPGLAPVPGAAAGVKGGLAMKIVVGAVLAGALAGGAALLMPGNGDSRQASPPAPAGKPAEPVAGPPELEHFACATNMGILDGPRLQALFWHHTGGAPDEKGNLFTFTTGTNGLAPCPIAGVRCARVDGMMETIVGDDHWAGTRELDEGPASCLPAIHPSGASAYGAAFVSWGISGSPLEGGDKGCIYLGSALSGTFYKIYRNKDKGHRWWFTRLGGATPLPTEVGKTISLKDMKAKGVVVGQDPFGVHLVSQGNYYALDETKLTATCLLSAADYRGKAMGFPDTDKAFAGKPLGPAEDIVRTEDGNFFIRYYSSAGVGCIFRVSPDRSKVEVVLKCEGGNTQVPDGPGIGCGFGGGPFFSSVEGNAILLNPVDGSRGRRLMNGRVSTLCVDGEWREIPKGPDERKPEYKCNQWFFQMLRYKGMKCSYLTYGGSEMPGHPGIYRVAPVDWTKPTVGPRIREEKP